MKLIPPILALLFMLSACGDESKVSDANSPETTSSIPTDQPVTKTKQSKMTIGLDQLRLRSTPGEKGEEIGHLKKGTVVYETGEVSDFTSQIKLRGIWFDEPWIKIKTDEGLEGWVYGGAVIFDMDSPSAISNKLLDLRLRSFFGNQLTDQMHSYRKAYYSAKNSQDFSNVFKKGEQLRDTLVTILEDKIDVMSMDYEQLPDLFWVEEALPGYETALVAEGTIYYLLQDFKAFQKIANKTEGKEDDDFVNLNLKVHASDSVEYFFPAWVLQTWDYGGHSKLGQEIHLDILKEADKNLTKSDLFLAHIMKIKDQIVYDIVSEEVTYWEPIDNIKKELDDIIKSNLGILTSDDKIALETRRTMFDNFKANAIEVNHKSGISN